jgi:hypothetical protein
MRNSAFGVDLQRPAIVFRCLVVLKRNEVLPELRAVQVFAFGVPGINACSDSVTDFQFGEDFAGFMAK